MSALEPSINLIEQALTQLRAMTEGEVSSLSSSSLRRALIANLVLEVSRVVREEHFLGKKKTCDLFLLGAALVAAAGKPRSASALARQAGSPAPRRCVVLDELCEAGVLREGGDQIQGDWEISFAAAAGYLVNLVHKTSAELSQLSKLDTNRT